jgi:predicted ribosome quality control (RQC) complex YloA/Tae2 family protein|tara:strand:+ start:93 stop:410 length:318 start_codon:yes stop_codon:yes gene_type:complete
MKEFTMDGFTILIGQNAHENDELVRNSEPNDWWLHISRGSSAHGVIKNPNNSRVPHKILKYCCRNIKHFNNAGKKIEFDVTKIKNVIPTDIPGRVNLKTSKQIKG